MIRCSIVALLAAHVYAGGAVYDRCDSLGPEDKANGKSSGWAHNDGSFCRGAQQSPIDLCGATTIDAGNEDSQVKLSLTNMAIKSTMQLSTDGQVYISPPTTTTYTADTPGAYDTDATGATLAGATWRDGIGVKVGRQAAGTIETTWKLAQAHFHWGRDGHQDEGSEHYIEGVQHPLEVHFVHVNTKYADITAALRSGNEDALLVVGQFFKVSDAAPMSATLTEINSKLAGVGALAAGTVQLSIAPYGLIDQSDGFYTYAGSLTTPTCNEAVTWVVMNKVSTITSAALDRFHDKSMDTHGHKAAYGNYRPLQALGDRTVYFVAPRDNVGNPITSTYKGMGCHKHVREPHFKCAPLTTPEHVIKMQDMQISLQQAMTCCAGNTVA